VLKNTQQFWKVGGLALNDVSRHQKCLGRGLPFREVLIGPRGQLRDVHLAPSEPDKAGTYGYDARAVVDHCSIVRPCEQSCPLSEIEKPNSNKWRANDPKDDLHDSSFRSQSTVAILIEAQRAAMKKAAERTRRLRNIWLDQLRPFIGSGVAGS
jgi:hypothetical protein